MWDLKGRPLQHDSVVSAVPAPKYGSEQSQGNAAAAAAAGNFWGGWKEH